MIMLLNILRGSYLGDPRGVVVSFADVSVAHYLYWMIIGLLLNSPPIPPLPSRGPQGQAIVAIVAIIAIVSKVSNISKVVTEHGRTVEDYQEHITLKSYS